MADDPTPHRAEIPGTGDRDVQAQFEVVPGSGRQPASVRAAGDIDLGNAGQFQAALTEAAATSNDVTVDMTAVTYCDSAAINALFTVVGQARLTIVVPETGPITTVLKVAGLDQITTVMTPQ
jgi:anti-sigma B factor antagonist